MKPTRPICTCASLSAVLFLVSIALADVKADTFEPYRIPLYIFNIGSLAAPEYKVGINVNVGAVTNDGAAVWRMYEFDTGGTGFLGFPYQAPVGATLPGDAGEYQLTYASKNNLQGNRTTTTITFEGLTSQGVAPSVTANMAIITSATSPNDSALAQWINVLPNAPPLEEYFYGDFGMSLGTLVNTSGSNPLYAIIPQLGTSANTGFIIHLGNVPDPNAPVGSHGEIGSGYIQVGLTPVQQLPTAWERTAQMVAPTSVFPGTGAPAYTEILSQGQLILDPVVNSGTWQSGIVYDTGAPNTAVHPVNMPTNESSTITRAIDNAPAVVTPLTLRGTGLLGTDGTVLQYDVGTEIAVNDATISLANVINSPGLYVNTGITAFFGNDVVFSLTAPGDPAGPGFVGFNSISVPEIDPAGMGSVLAAIAASFGLLERRRKCA